MKAIIFDMDGVIFDTERVGDQAWRQAAEEMGFAQIDDAISQCRGLNRADTKAFLRGNTQIWITLRFTSGITRS